MIQRILLTLLGIFAAIFLFFVAIGLFLFNSLRRLLGLPPLHNLFFRSFSPFSTRSTSQSSAEASTAASSQSAPKVFSDSEGEYIDFEEV